MRRVLVPLDGSRLAESILPDARRLAGSGGTLILVRAMQGWTFGYQMREVSDGPAAEDAQRYLNDLAARLRTDGDQVETHTFLTTNLALSIDRAAEVFHADMIACATHGRSLAGRLVRGGVAWRTVADSSVPVLLRHAEDRPGSDVVVIERRHIMVPLDGSAYAEKALPVAQNLALEWRAPMRLVRVVPDPPVIYPPFGPGPMIPYDYIDDLHIAEAYLNRITRCLKGEIYTQVSAGPIVDQIADIAEDFSITDIVMASHGRTGLSRAILGSVADGLIQRLRCPIILLPAMVAERVDSCDTPVPGWTSHALEQVAVP